MKEFIKKRHVIPIAVWLVCYMALFLYLEVCVPEDVHLISCGLDRVIPHVPAFIYAYLSWFPYILICAFLAIRNLGEEDFRKAVMILVTGMNIFLVISFVWPTGLDLREGITYDLSTVSGQLMRFVQTVDAPKSVFPSMHVYVTLVLQYTLEMQKDRLPLWGVRTGRFFAVMIILSTMFTKQHSAVDVTGACVMFAGLVLGYTLWQAKTAGKEEFSHGQTE